MLLIRLDCGLDRTIDQFIADMEFSGYVLAARYKNLTMPSCTLKFHRPVP